MQRKVVIFGDSLTTGENNRDRGIGCIYKKMHPEDNVIYHAVSGICIGNYSIYPVDPVKESLLGLLKENQLDVKDADDVILEFGVNDTTALSCHYVGIQQVAIDLVKARDFIKQLNPKASVKFIVSSKKRSNSYFNKYAKLHVDYLKNEYAKEVFKDYLQVNDVTWKFFYGLFIAIVEELFDTLDIDLFKYTVMYLDEDGVHPKEEGYKKIVAEIKM